MGRRLRHAEHPGLSLPAEHPEGALLGIDAGHGHGHHAPVGVAPAQHGAPLPAYRHAAGDLGERGGDRKARVHVPPPVQAGEPVAGLPGIEQVAQLQVAGKIRQPQAEARPFPVTLQDALAEAVAQPVGGGLQLLQLGFQGEGLGAGLRAEHQQARLPDRAVAPLEQAQGEGRPVDQRGSEVPETASEMAGVGIVEEKVLVAQAHLPRWGPGRRAMGGGDRRQEQGKDRCRYPWPHG